MNISRFTYVLSLIVIASVLSGCGPGQFLGPTITPSPTNTPLPTATRTPTPSPTPTVVPTPLGGGPQIVFASNRNGNWEIYRMNSDGSHATRLTTSPTTNDYLPKYSPDGTVLLYWSYTEQPLSADLEWMMPDGSGGTFVSNILGWTAFSPDGKTVAVTAFTGNNNTDIFVVPSAGGKLKQLTNNRKWDYEPAWSPDGKTIAFVSERDGTPHIYLMDTDGKNQRRLTQSEMNELEPAWSPDGKKLAFLSEDGNTHSNIYIVDGDGTNVRNLTDQTGSYNESPAWSPDGRMIAFWSDRTGNHEIFVIRLDGSGLMNLTNSPGEDEDPNWSK